MNEEKWEFTISRSGTLGEPKNIEEKVFLTESQLKEEHIDILVGELIRAYNYSPPLARARFVKFLKEKAPKHNL